MYVFSESQLIIIITPWMLILSPSDWLLCPLAKALLVFECTIVFLPQNLSQAHFAFFLPGI